MSNSRLLEIFVTLSMFIIALLFYNETQHIPPPEYDILGAAAVPKAVAIIIMVLCTIHLASLFFSKPKAENLDALNEQINDIKLENFKNNFVPFVGFLICVLGYVLSFQYEWLHFIIITFIFCFASIVLLSDFNKRATYIAVVIASTLSVGLYFIFTKIFVIRLPGVY